MSLFVALVSDTETNTLQVCASREAALFWLVSQIPDEHWHLYYDQLSDVERTEGGITRDRAGMTHEQILTEYAGDPDDDVEPCTWGNDMYQLRIEEQELFTTTDPVA